MRIRKLSCLVTLHAVLSRVQVGVEVVIEEDNRPIAVLHAPEIKVRKISEVVDALEANGASATIDEEFAQDVEEGINAHREPWNPRCWE